MELPTHCYDCGAYLMGGATKHKPDCVFGLMIEHASELFPNMPERSVLRVREKPHFRPERAGETIIEVLRDGVPIADIYGSREGIQIVSARVPKAAIHLEFEGTPPGLLITLLAPEEPCPLCEGTDEDCPVCRVRSEP